MINANELRIGNNVATKTGKILTVSTLQYEKTEGFAIIGFLEDEVGHLITSTKEDKVDPILITQPILKSYGFTNDFGMMMPIDLKSGRERLDVNEKTGIAILHVTTTLGRLAFISFKCEYVHQLQNLYHTLTGNELKTSQY